MAAEASRAPSGREQTNFARPPRMPAHRSSLAATAATLLPPDPLAAAWAAAWIDLGGTLLSGVDGHRFVGWSHEAPEVAARFADWSDEQAQGARRVLIEMLEAAGADALGSVFTVGMRRA